MHLSRGTKEEGTTSVPLRARQLRGRPGTVDHLARSSARLVHQRPDVRHAVDGISKATRVELADKMPRHVNSVIPRWGTSPVDDAELVARDNSARRQRVAGDKA
mgnify:CR=1 FL=1